MQGAWGAWWLLRRPRWLLRGPMLPLDSLRTLYSHAETTRGAAASGCISAVCQVRQARRTRVLRAVAWWGVDNIGKVITGAQGCGRSQV